MRTATLGLALALSGCPTSPAVVDGGPDAPSDLDAPFDGWHGALDAPLPDASADASSADAGGADADGTDGGTTDAASPTDAGAADGGPDAPGPRTFDVRVLADGACSDLSFDPPSIRVPAGTSFTVNWINATGCTDVDIDKDGTVPIVLGLAPGASYHDTVREWCGIFTGTFSFRAYYAPSFPYYLDVDCSG